MEIRLLGELEVVRGGRPIPLPPSKKTRALLAYLVASGEPQPRARLCDLLWEGPDDPRAALRWSLTKIRALFADGARSGGPIVANLERVTFDADGTAVDLLEHRRDVAQGFASQSIAELERAAARFRGDFLEGLELPDCYRFHEWCVAEREALRRQRVGILSALVERHDAEPEQALAHARAWAQIEPIADRAHVAVVRLLGRLGRRREALQQYERCRRLLETELRAAPSALLEQARASLDMVTPPRESVAPTEAPDLGGATPEVRVPRAVVGRDAERAVLIGALDAAARAGAPAPAVVLGEPGVGKSRLLDDLAAEARARGGLALVGRAFEAEMVRPYGVWTDALRSVPLSRAAPALLSELSALLPELSDAPQAGLDRARLYDVVVGLLSSLARPGRPVVVVLDDVQWIDEASAALSHYVARASIPGIVLALGARPGEVDDNPAAVRLFRTLRRDARLADVPLGPLSFDDTVKLVRALDPEADAARVHAESEGHPLFTIELVRARGLEPGTPGLPSTLTGLLRERLEKLDVHTQSLLTWAAALGRSFELGVLVDVLGRAAPDVLLIVEDLERRGLFVSAAAGTTQFGYDFSHDLVRRAAYDRLSEPRRKLCHGHISGVLSKALAGDDSLAGEVLRHAALGGDDAVAARAAVLAGRRCLRLFAYAEAGEIVDRGLRHVAKLPPAARLAAEVELFALLAEAEPLRRSAEVEEALVRAIAEADRMGALELLVEAYRALAMLQHQRGDLLAGTKSLDRSTVAGRAASVETVVSALAHAGRCYAMVGWEITRARELLREARELAERHGVIQPEIALGEACLAQFDGDADRATQLFGTTLVAVRAAADHWRECECLVRMAMGAVDRDAWGEATALIDELAEVAAKMGEGATEPHVAKALRALVALGRGDDNAAADIESALSMLRAIDTKGMLAYVLGSVGRMDVAAGALDVAAERALEALKMAICVHSDDDAAVALALLAEIAYARGAAEEAKARLAEATARGERPDTISARSRASVERARARLSRPMG